MRIDPVIQRIARQLSDVSIVVFFNGTPPDITGENITVVPTANVEFGSMLVMLGTTVTPEGMLSAYRTLETELPTVLNTVSIMGGTASTGG